MRNIQLIDKDLKAALRQRDIILRKVQLLAKERREAVDEINSLSQVF